MHRLLQRLAKGTWLEDRDLSCKLVDVRVVFSYLSVVLSTILWRALNRLLSAIDSGRRQIPAGSVQCMSDVVAEIVAIRATRQLHARDACGLPLWDDEADVSFIFFAIFERSQLVLRAFDKGLL